MPNNESDICIYVAVSFMLFEYDMKIDMFNLIEHIMMIYDMYRFSDYLRKYESQKL